MILIIASKENRETALAHLPAGTPVQYISPRYPRAVYGAEKVLIVGNHAAVARRYQGIVPVEIINTGEEKNGPDIRDTGPGE